MKRKFNKLVRDNIPEIITSEGRKVTIQILDDYDYQVELTKKLVEEAQEYSKSGYPEELADILEVIYSLAKLHNINLEKLEDLRFQKSRKCGGFAKRVFLVESD